MEVSQKLIGVGGCSHKLLSLGETGTFTAEIAEHAGGTVVISMYSLCALCGEMIGSWGLGLSALGWRYFLRPFSSPDRSVTWDISSLMIPSILSLPDFSGTDSLMPR